MSQVIAGCCCTPPAPANCCDNASGLPSTITVDITVTTQNQIRQYRSDPFCPSNCPYREDLDIPIVYRNITMTGSLVLWRYDEATNQLGLGCTYYPLAGTSSFQVEEEDGTINTIDNAYPLVLSQLYTEDFLATTGTGTCGQLLRNAIPVDGGIVWAKLRITSLSGGANVINGFLSSNINASQTCACWELEVEYALDPRRLLVQQCPAFGVRDQVANQRLVVGDGIHPVIINPIFTKSGTGFEDNGFGNIRNFNWALGRGSTFTGRKEGMRVTSTEVVGGKWKPSSVLGEYQTVLIDPIAQAMVCQGSPATTGTRIRAIIS